MQDMGIDWLSNLKPNFQKILEWSLANEVNGLYVYTNDLQTASMNFLARGFNPKTGHHEDAATGVAAAALSAVFEKNIIVKQGQSLNRPCQIITKYLGEGNVLVGGIVSIRRINFRQ